MSEKSNFPLWQAAVLGFLVLVFLIVISTSGKLSCNENRVSPKTNNPADITWQNSFRENGVTVIPGSVQTNFGRFELRWVIGAGGRARLATLESPGVGEMPPVEKKIFIFPRDNGTTLLFQEWFPLLNEKRPSTLKMITSVPTGQLFSVLPGEMRPPVAAIGMTTQPIQWGKKYQRYGSQYLPGKLKTSFGWREIFWKKKTGRIPELITLETPSAGARPPLESRLYPWLDETGDTVIFQERSARFNQDSTPYLWPLAKVQTAELMLGFRDIY